MYEIRVRGHLGPALADAFAPMTATAVPAETVLVGPTFVPFVRVLGAPGPPQAALHGLLARVQALGLELVEIRRRIGTANGLTDRRGAREERVDR